MRSAGASAAVIQARAHVAQLRQIGCFLLLRSSRPWVLRVAAQAGWWTRARRPGGSASPVAVSIGSRLLAVRRRGERAGVARFAVATGPSRRGSLPAVRLPALRRGRPGRAARHPAAPTVLGCRHRAGACAVGCRGTCARRGPAAREPVAQGGRHGRGKLGEPAPVGTCRPRSGPVRPGARYAGGCSAARGCGAGGDDAGRLRDSARLRSLRFRAESEMATPWQSQR